MKQDFLDFEKPIVDLENKLEDLRSKNADKPTKGKTRDIERKEAKLEKLRAKIYDKLSPWQRVQIARHPRRPYSLDYAELCFDEFVELHGDRHIGDDESMPCGLARLGGHRVVFLGQQKGRDTKENLRRNFGSAHPEGYRKALRLMKMAERFSLPVVTLIDTPGAFPGVESEQRNIAEAIAFNLKEMMALTTPIVAVVIGEGGSGGALGIGVADRVLMLENSYYSVISPEGCAAILWKDRKHAPEAAETLKISAPDLKKLGIIDGIISEPDGGAHNDHQAAANNLRKQISRHLTELNSYSTKELLTMRYEKFREFGEFTEAA